jgi:peptidyl-prolyl cis-trans isomerase SurA
MLSIKRRVDSVYNLIESKKLSFGDAAKQFSDDRTSNYNNGELPEFGAAKFDTSFENKVLQMQFDSAISKPFETKYGFHILKRISVTPFNGEYLNSSDANNAFKEKVLANERIEKAKDRFISSLITTTKYKENNSITKKEKSDALNFVLGSDTAKNYMNLPLAKKIIVSFGKVALKGEKWYKFLENYKLSKGDVVTEVDVLWKQFTEQLIMEQYKSNIEVYSPEIKMQLQEFREGNMLFEIMERNVWSKASQDDAALKDLYNKNKQSYLWNASATVLVLNSASAASTNKVLELVQQGKSIASIVEQYNGQVQADSGRYELEQVTIDNTKIAAGAYSSIVTNNDGSQTFIKYIAVHPPKEQRSFTDARGLLVNDYQVLLEKQWIAELKKKYAVKINQPVWQQLQKELR